MPYLQTAALGACSHAGFQGRGIIFEMQQQRHKPEPLCSQYPTAATNPTRQLILVEHSIYASVRWVLSKLSLDM